MLFTTQREDTAEPVAFILIRWTEVGGKASLLVQLQQQSEDRILQANAERVYLPSSVDFIHSTDPSGKLNSAQKRDFNLIFFPRLKKKKEV